MHGHRAGHAHLGRHHDHGADGACPRRRGRPRSEQAEKAILKAAVDLLTRHGVAGLSIEAVAARAGVAKTTVYRRWARKADLVLDAIASVKGAPLRPPGGTVRDDLVFLLEQMRARRRSPSGRLLGRICAEVRDNPALLALFSERIVLPGRAVLREVLERGVREGLIDPAQDLDLLGELLAAPIVLASVWPFAPADRPVAQIVDTVLAGAAVRPGIGVGQDRQV